MTKPSTTQAETTDVEVEDLGADNSEDDLDKFYTPATTIKKGGIFDFLNDDKILKERARIEAKGDYQEEKRILEKLRNEREEEERLQRSAESKRRYAERMKKKAEEDRIIQDQKTRKRKQRKQ